jgi:GH25 family lysozyme M1 (1,4-beta-N-acetylmuramidase)
MTTGYFPAAVSDVVIDLSHWQAPVDFAKAKSAGIAAVIFKGDTRFALDRRDIRSTIRCRNSRRAARWGLPLSR